MAHDTAIYDIIVESFVSSRIGNIIAFFLQPFLFKEISCFQMSLPKLKGKRERKQRDYKHIVKWKWLLKLWIKLHFINCVEWYKDLHSSLFFCIVKNPPIFLATYEKLSLNCLDIWKIFPLNLVNFGHLFHLFPCINWKSYFSDQYSVKYSLVIFVFWWVRSRLCTLLEGPRLQTTFLKGSWFFERK